MHARVFYIGCFVFAFAVCVFAAEKPKDIDPSLSTRVAAIFRQLNSDDYRIRDAASAEIDALPAEALPLIEQALSTGALSPEVSLRLEEKISLLRGKAVSSAYEASLRRDLEWNRATSLATYDNGGHTNPKWDAAAREAIILNIRPIFDHNLSTKDAARIDDAFRKAVELGCDDPFLLYIQANRYRLSQGHDPQKAFEMMERAAGGLIAGKTSPFRKLMGAARRAEARCALEPGALDPAVKLEVSRDLDLALSLLPDLSQQGTPRAFVVDAAHIIFSGYSRVLGDHDKAFEKVDAVFRPSTAGTDLADIFTADVHLTRAETIRTSNDVRANQAEKSKPIADLYAKAKTAAESAVAIDPQDPIALIQMLRVLVYLNVPRDEFDRWFDKAMSVYPNNLRACQIKREYLERTADQSEWIAFGRECLAGGNWSARIPLIAMDVHFRISRFDRPEEHFTKPEVWEDVHAAEEGYLSRYPNAVFDRTCYARVACFAEHWDIAKAQFDLLGDQGVHSVFRGKPTYDYYRRKADKLASAKQ